MPEAVTRIDQSVTPWTAKYVKRLVIERFAIRAAIENPGGSLILGAAQRVETDPVDSYSSVIGNDLHLDLMDAEKILSEELSEDQLKEYILWCDGLSPHAAAEYRSVKHASIRKRGERIAKKLNEQSE